MQTDVITTVQECTDASDQERISFGEVVMKLMQAGVERVHVDADILRYCVDLAAATRADRTVEVGASPRGSQALMLVARSLAVMDGRDYVTPDDVKRVAVPALAHRLTLTPAAWAAGTDAARIVAGIVDMVPGPPVVARGGTVHSGTGS